MNTLFNRIAAVVLLPIILYTAISNNVNAAEWVEVSEDIGTGQPNLIAADTITQIGNLRYAWSEGPTKDNKYTMRIYASYNCKENTMRPEIMYTYTKEGKVIDYDSQYIHTQSQNAVKIKYKTPIPHTLGADNMDYVCNYSVD